MTEGAPLFTPVALLTGGLGSGKTTLLKRLLADPALVDTAVLINEFGEVGLDHHLLGRIDETVVLLRSGCLCCTIRGELADAMRDLLDRRERGGVPPFRRVVIETTGLADPFPVLTTLQADPVLKRQVVIGGIICTVDAVNFPRQFAARPETVKQIAAADRIVVTKSDLALAAGVHALQSRLGQLNPAASILRSADAWDATMLLDRNAAGSTWTWRANDGAAHGVEPGAHVHGPDTHAFALTFDHPLDWTAFGIWLTMLLNRHGDSVLRVKGILNVAGSDAPVAIHGVQHLVHLPEHMPGWPSADRRSRIVFIVNGLDRATVERSMASFMALASASNELPARA